MIDAILNSMEKRPIVFGEVLFDEFPDGSSVMGGAPFNVAWHLQGFGLQPLLVSAVGDDEAGKRVLDTMTAWGMDSSNVQILSAYPTGRVSVSLQDGQPAFDILDQQAYDHIRALPDKSDDFALLYHGSLALRHAVCRNTLDKMVQALQLPAFIDINLRPPWWQKDDIEGLLLQAHWVKLNEHELAAIYGQDSLPSAQWESLARDMLDKFALQQVILTLGEQGACYIEREQTLRGAPVPVRQLQDTVGAGDAFSAVTILGLVRQWPGTQTLQRALAFASAICEQRGATATNTNLYQKFLEQWQ